MTDNQVEYKKITDFEPDNANANRGTERGLRMLDDSLSLTGAGRSIVVDKHGRIIGGNKTTERAIDNGIEDAIVVHTTGDKLVVVQRDDLDLYDPAPDNRARLMAYFDNRVGQLDLDWNPEQLLADNQLGVPLEKFFTGAELLDMGITKADDSPEDSGSQVDRADELQAVWQVQRGDLWVIGKHKLLCGDSTIAADVAKLMQGELAQLVVTDPPYGVSYADKNAMLNTIGRGNRIQHPIENDHLSKEGMQVLWKSAFKQMSDVMDKGAVVYCFMPQGGDQMMMMMMQGAGIEPRHELIWLKNNHVLGRVDYAYKHEPILYAWKEGGHKFYGDFQTSIIECDKPLKSDLHPTMKPVDILCTLIENSSLTDDIVYDLFGGSGSLMVACEQLSRQCRMIEISEKYCAVILQRMQDMGLTPIKADG